MKSHHASPALAAPAPAAPAVAPGSGVDQPYGNAALAEELAAQAQGQSSGPEIAMGRGHALGSLVGFGIAAANALGSGGLPAALNPSGYWGKPPPSPAPSLVRPGPSALVRPID